MPSSDAAAGRRWLEDPEYWRERAVAARGIAEEMFDPVARQMMLEVAEGYDRLARRVASRVSH